VAFHGCLQYESKIGDAFYARAGYNEWAESNAIIILYPQTAPKYHFFILPWPNPAGCWDWWGYTGTDFHHKSAPQMATVKAMIERLSNR
jgi:poly(3-hydroxybutyrate) depolymerase